MAPLPHRTQKSARHDYLLPHQDRLQDEGRNRPQIPSGLTDLADVVDNQGVLAGQAIHYDPSTGLYLHRSRQLPFGSGSGAVTTGSTGPMELPYDGAITTFVVLLSTPGSDDTILDLFFNGGSIQTATLAAGVPRVQYGIDPAQDVAAFSDLLEVVCGTAGTGAAGLSGYILV